MRKKMGLKRRTALAEKRAADSDRRMRDMNRRLRECNAVSDGAMILTQILAGMIGPEFHISAEEVERGKRVEYMAAMNPDGSYDFCRKDLIEAGRRETDEAEPGSGEERNGPEGAALEGVCPDG